MIVRNTDSGPDTTDLFRSLTEHLEMPDLFRIGDRQALAPIAITVLLDELPHQADGVARCRAALQDDHLQLLDHEHAFLVHQLFPAGDGGLADTQLLLVEAGIGGVQELVSRAYLWNSAFQGHLRAVVRVLGMHAAGENLQGRVALVGRGGDNLHPGTIITVTSMTGDHGSVGRSLFADHDTGTTLRIVHRFGEFDLLCHCCRAPGTKEKYIS